MAQIDDEVRAWARGIYPAEAGAELLLRAGLAAAGPWLRRAEATGGLWLDADLITDDTIGRLSGGQQRILRIAASLLGGAPVNLYEEVPGLDRDHLALVLAAIAHAGGSHEHSGALAPDPEGRWVNAEGVRVGFPRLGSLFGWPPVPDTTPRLTVV